MVTIDLGAVLDMISSVIQAMRSIHFSFLGFSINMVDFLIVLMLVNLVITFITAFIFTPVSSEASRWAYNEWREDARMFIGKGRDKVE